MLTQKGQSFIELLVAMGIFSLVSLSAFLVFFGGQSLAVDSQNAQIANDYAAEGSEAVRLIRDRSWAELSDGSHGLVLLNGQWYFASSTSDSKDIFTRTIAISTADSNTKRATTTITWEVNPLRTQTVEFVELLTSWSIVQDTGGDTGGSGISGDWRNPRTLGSVDLGPGVSATDLDVKSKYVYLSGEASATSKHDFFIVNATNGQSPQLVSSLDLGSKGLNSIDVAGFYAYGANQATNAQLKVISVANLDNPTVAATLQLPGVSGSGAVGNTIFFYDDKIYIGTKKASGPEFHIIDVSSPGNPSFLGSYEVGEDVNDIYIVGTTAYLATNHDSKRLLVLDVANPTGIVQAGFFNNGSSDDGKSVFPVGSISYFGAISGSNNFSIYDISNLSSITQLSATNLSADLNDLTIRDTLAFLATSDSNKEFQVWNIASSTNPILWSSLNFSQVANGIDFEDNIVYVSVRSNDALRIITSSP